MGDLTLYREAAVVNPPRWGMRGRYQTAVLRLRPRWRANERNTCAPRRSRILRRLSLSKRPMVLWLDQTERQGTLTRWGALVNRMLDVRGPDSPPGTACGRSSMRGGETRLATKRRRQTPWTLSVRWEWFDRCSTSPSWVPSRLPDVRGPRGPMSASRLGSPSRPPGRNGARSIASSGGGAQGGVGAMFHPPEGRTSIENKRQRQGSRDFMGALYCARPTADYLSWGPRLRLVRWRAT